MTGKELGERSAFPTHYEEDLEGFTKWEVATLVFLRMSAGLASGRDNQAIQWACEQADTLFEE